MRSARGYLPIGDYALLGNCRTAALVAPDGAVDWLCLPHFDSPSVFAAILDAGRGGHFAVRPAVPYEVKKRRYLPSSSVLETTFRGPDGELRLLDAMIVGAGDESREPLAPSHELAREATCVDGAIELEIEFAPRPRFGRARRLEQRGRLGVACAWHGELLLLTTSEPVLRIGEDGTARGIVRLRRGDRFGASLTYCRHSPAVVPALGVHLTERIESTDRWWRRWADNCRYRGPHREAMLRSLLTLKLLSFSPSGAIVAAATTSLPEALGGKRNWDYRYCWLRDASMTVEALVDCGYELEASAFVDWLLHTTRRRSPRLQTVYDVFGETHLREREIDLEGYEGSSPVRVGNAAERQLQLDIQGELLDAMHVLVCRGERPDPVTRRLLRRLGEQVCDSWRKPDNGIWEVRSDRRHHTHSKVLCWVALDRLLRIDRQIDLGIDQDRVRSECHAIRLAVERHGYDATKGCYVATFDDSRDVDASLLLLPRYGYVSYKNPRMRRTLARIESELCEPPFVYRYPKARDDGMHAEEGAFSICSFWWIACLAESGERDRAKELLHEMIASCGALGLYGEQIDARTRRQLGNYPQAFTHVGLVDALLTVHGEGTSPRGRAEGRRT